MGALFDNISTGCKCFDCFLVCVCVCVSVLVCVCVCVTSTESLEITRECVIRRQRVICKINFIGVRLGNMYPVLFIYISIVTGRIFR